jgi:DNA-binding GntR family transcriptional regulator
VGQNGHDNRLLEICRAGSERFVKADDLAAATLREAIIKGILAPGQEIDEEMVARNLNISRMPVRQAMGVLEAEGLVKRAYRRGVTVTELSAAGIEELFYIRSSLEGLAVRRAVPNYREEHVIRLRECFSQLEASIEKEESYLEVNDRFHELLYEPCEWGRLLSLIKQLRNNAARYLILARDRALAHEFIVMHSDHAVGHRKILEACENRDGERAEILIRKHILDAMTVLLKSFDTARWGEKTG